MPAGPGGAARHLRHPVAPRGFGTIARRVFVLTWRAGRGSGRRSRSTELAGPAAMVLTAATWTALVVAGFALVYLPRLPEGFTRGPAADPGLLDAVAVSAVAVTTLGLSELTPVAGPLRIAVPAQALVGFVLLTAIISWVLQVYPALGRRRTLARRLGILAEVGADETLADGDPAVVTSLLTEIQAGVTAVEMDLMQYAETYYFREQDPTVRLAEQLSVVPDLVDAAARSDSAEIRLAGRMLGAGLRELSRRLEQDFLPGRSVDVVTAYRDDHR
ncbi:hypothetical protein HMPREF0063_10909 [Aeromicrobium marinum DSM 15272]|uniref:Ion channel n=1 Tax=Aeromicrobium marinum DSM 15272 TaxID=585531 RepID=E2SAB9_9ACTN|nr:hypothetical protein HMPREF0063_10909 [Aeromicrobium marinum DSM 15272]